MQYFLYIILYAFSFTLAIAQNDPKKEIRKEDSNFVYVYKKDFILTGQVSKITYRKTKYATNDSLIRMNDTVRGNISANNTVRHYINENGLFIYEVSKRVEINSTQARVTNVTIYFSESYLYSFSVGINSDSSIHAIALFKLEGLDKESEEIFYLSFNKCAGAFDNESHFAIDGILFRIFTNNKGQLTGWHYLDQKKKEILVVNIAEDFHLNSLKVFDFLNKEFEIINFNGSNGYYYIESRGPCSIEKRSDNLLKSGEWKYYNKDEKLTKKELWKDNVLIKSENIK